MKSTSFMTLFKSIFSDDMGIDLGTMNTLFCQPGRDDVILNQPSAIAISPNTGQVLAVGDDAKAMIGRCPPNIRVLRPIKNGVITDTASCDRMLSYFINLSRSHFKLMQPRLLIGVPYELSTVEIDAVRNCAHKAGAREVRLVSQPYAAAVGAGLPVTKPKGSMVVDIGGGTTGVAVISLGSMANASCIKVGGDALDAAIVAYIHKKHNIGISELTAEDIKKRIGTACKTDEPQEIEVRGLDMGIHENRLPRSIMLNSNEVQEALEGPVQEIIRCVRRTIDKSEPSLAADLVETGIKLTGGGAQLRGLDYRLEQETGIPVTVADDPLKSVINGIRKLLLSPKSVFDYSDDKIIGCAE